MPGCAPAPPGASANATIGPHSASIYELVAVDQVDEDFLQLHARRGAICSVALTTTAAEMLLPEAAAQVDALRWWEATTALRSANMPNR